MRRLFSFVGALASLGGLYEVSRLFTMYSREEPIVHFSAGKPDSQLTISRQSDKIYEDRAKKYTFRRGQLHKEYVIDVFRGRPDEGKTRVCDRPLFVRIGDGRMCGTGLFTKTHLSCDPLSSQSVQTVIDDLHGLEPITDRAVGVEFEFTARQLTPEAYDSLWRFLLHHNVQLPGPFRARAEILGVKMCSIRSMIPASREGKSGDKSGDKSGGRCNRNSDCSLIEYCSIHGMCEDRSKCQHDSFAKEKKCPVALPRWNWDWDGSVRPLSPSEAKSIGAHRNETQGIPFEVKSPDPPHALSGTAGFKSIIEMLTLLRHVGIQAGPSQGLHVHVNVMSPKVPGAKLSPAQIASVWAAYAKYQLVIDEMLSPGRPGQQYAQRLFLGHCKITQRECTRDPCSCTRRLFMQMHQWLRIPRWVRIYRGMAPGFCNGVLATPGSPNPCQRKYPLQRYFQVNLATLDRYGTIEFRAHSATYDAERVTRWVQFLVGFVEYYGRGQGFRKMQAYFSPSSPRQAYAKLQQAQRQASAAELFKDLEGLIDPGSADYYGFRIWERSDDTCYPRKFKPSKECCDEEKVESYQDENADQGNSEGNSAETAVRSGNGGDGGREDNSADNENRAKVMPNVSARKQQEVRKNRKYKHDEDKDKFKHEEDNYRFKSEEDKHKFKYEEDKYKFKYEEDKYKFKYDDDKDKFKSEDDKDKNSFFRAFRSSLNLAAFDPHDLLEKEKLATHSQCGCPNGGSEGPTFVRPEVVSTERNYTLMRAPVPPDAMPESYLEVQMPQGNVRALLLNEESIRRGFHDFAYDKGIEEQVRFMLNSF